MTVSSFQPTSIVVFRGLIGKAWSVTLICFEEIFEVDVINVRFSTVFTLLVYVGIRTLLSHPVAVTWRDLERLCHGREDRIMVGLMTDQSLDQSPGHTGLDPNVASGRRALQRQSSLYSKL